MIYSITRYPAFYIFTNDAFGLDYNIDLDIFSVLNINWLYK